MRSVFLFFFIIASVSIFSQSANFRAQGKYYSAKRSIEEKEYSKAITYIEACKELLNGKTNKEIQYLHIIAAYKAERYTDASNEIERFFNIFDGIEEPLKFDKSVEELTNDEVREITKLIDLVDEGIISKKEEFQFEQLEDAISYLRYDLTYYIKNRRNNEFMRIDSHDADIVNGDMGNIWEPNLVSLEGLSYDDWGPQSQIYLTEKDDVLRIKNIEYSKVKSNIVLIRIFVTGNYKVRYTWMRGDYANGEHGNVDTKDMPYSAYDEEFHYGYSEYYVKGNLDKIKSSINTVISYYKSN